VPSIRTSAALAAVAALISVAPAHAGTSTPDVRQHLTGGVATFVLGKDKVVYQISVSTSLVSSVASTQPYSYAVVAVSKCPRSGCLAPTTYLARLTASQFTATDPKSFSITVTAFGKPLTVTWTGAGPSSPVDRDPAVTATLLDFKTEWPATATISVLGVTCSGATTTAVSAARHTTVYTGGFVPPTGNVALPAAPVKGGPALAKACRAGAR
jgi:hypothetical protein